MAANRHSLPSACRVPRLRRPLPRLGGHKVPATAHRPLVHAPRTIQASSRFTDGGPRARDSGSGPESAPGNRLPRRRPRGITGYAPARRPARAMASTAGRGLRGGGPAAGSTGRPNRWLCSKSRRGPPPGPHGGTDSSQRPTRPPQHRAGPWHGSLRPCTAGLAVASTAPRLPPRPPPTTAGLAERRLPTRPGRLHHPPRGATGQAEPGSTHTRPTPQARRWEKAAHGK